MPPTLPPRPKAKTWDKDQGWLIERKIRMTLQTASSYTESSMRAKSIGHCFDQMCESMRYYQHAIDECCENGMPAAYDNITTLYQGIYTSFDRQMLSHLREYEQDRKRTLFRYKDRGAQERSANKSVEELEQIDVLPLPDGAAREVARMLSDWRAQLSVLR